MTDSPQEHREPKRNTRALLVPMALCVLYVLSPPIVFQLIGPQAFSEAAWIYRPISLLVIYIPGFDGLYSWYIQLFPGSVILHFHLFP